MEVGYACARLGTDKQAIGACHEAIHKMGTLRIAVRLPSRSSVPDSRPTSALARVRTARSRAVAMTTRRGVWRRFWPRVPRRTERSEKRAWRRSSSPRTTEWREWSHRSTCTWVRSISHYTGVSLTPPTPQSSRQTCLTAPVLRGHHRTTGHLTCGIAPCRYRWRPIPSVSNVGLWRPQLTLCPPKYRPSIFLTHA